MVQNSASSLFQNSTLETSPRNSPKGDSRAKAIRTVTPHSAGMAMWFDARSSQCASTSHCGSPLRCIAMMRNRYSDCDAAMPATRPDRRKQSSNHFELVLFKADLGELPRKFRSFSFHHLFCFFHFFPIFIFPSFFGKPAFKTPKPALKQPIGTLKRQKDQKDQNRRLRAQTGT